MDTTSTQSILKEYIVREFLLGTDPGLDATSPLLQGIISSLRLVTLTVFIEQQFGTKVPEDELTPDNFANLDAIASLIERVRQPGAVAASA